MLYGYQIFQNREPIIWQICQPSKYSTVVENSDFIALCQSFFNFFWVVKILIFFTPFFHKRRGKVSFSLLPVFYSVCVESRRRDLEEKPLKQSLLRTKDFLFFLNRFLSAVTYFHLQLYLHSKACKPHNITLVLLRKNTVAQTISMNISFSTSRLGEVPKGPIIQSIVIIKCNYLSKA